MDTGALPKSIAETNPQKIGPTYDSDQILTVYNRKVMNIIFLKNLPDFRNAIAMVNCHRILAHYFSFAGDKDIGQESCSPFKPRVDNKVKTPSLASSGTACSTNPFGSVWPK